MLVERNMNLHVYSHWVSHGKYKILHTRQGAFSQGMCRGRVSDFIEAISYTHGTGRQSNSYHLNGVRIHSSGCNDTKSCTSGRG